MKIRYIVGLAMTVLGTIGVAACGSETCTTSADCTTAGDVCNADGVCEAGTTPDVCTTDAECATDETCDTATGKCVGSTTQPECQVDADCLGDEVCLDNACVVAGCASDADCISGGTCDTTTGECTVPAGITCQQCACTDTLAEGGCANVCKMSLNGTNTPNFCDNVAALPQCAKCLADNCGSLAIDAADPSTCE